MNKVMLIGNLTRDPELRTVKDGISVCDFTLAVNRRKKIEGQPEADFFRVTAWRGLGENCAKFLAKGRKVSVIGSVSVRTYQANDGTTRAQMEVLAEEVEFLTPKGETQSGTGGETAKAAETQDGFTPVETDDLPF